jgi:SAM-dependent methyltransferase
LRFEVAVARCECGAEFEISHGVPLLASAVSALSQRQAQWFDQEADPEWEIERPKGSPPLYEWLLQEKFRRAVENVELAGKTALSVCAGSGMDAELLARSGARVIALDISLGAIQRAVERARRHEFDLTPVVGDVTRLPFRDASVDVVYVHDGLHHLDEPLVGLAEMTRVAREVICVVEPAGAAVTSVAVRLGLALEREDAGNRVARLEVRMLESELERRGFRLARRERYVMFYRHEPGRLVRILSYGALAHAAIWCFRLLNVAVGRYGNKLTVVAVRR